MFPTRPVAQIEPVALPVSGSASLVDADVRLPGAVVSLAGWTRTAKPYHYNPVDKKLVALDFVRPGAFDSPQDIEAREVVVKSHDGVEIPVSMLVRKDIKLDGRNPTIVFGYGAYGITDESVLQSRRVRVARARRRICDRARPRQRRSRRGVASSGAQGH